jgi:thymidine phosphorylase
LQKKIGHMVKKGEALAEVWASDHNQGQSALAALTQAFTLHPQPPEVSPLVLQEITA